MGYNRALSSTRVARVSWDQGRGTQSYPAAHGASLRMDGNGLLHSSVNSSHMEDCKAKPSAGAGLQQGDVQMTSSQSYWLTDTKYNQNSTCGSRRHS